MQVASSAGTYLQVAHGFSACSSSAQLCCSGYLGFGCSAGSVPALVSQRGVLSAYRGVWVCHLRGQLYEGLCWAAAAAAQAGSRT